MGEIQRNSDPAECRHNNGDLNVADDVSRGVNDFRVKHLIGAFLQLPENQWPKEVLNAVEEKEIDTEKRKVLS